MNNINDLLNISSLVPYPWAFAKSDPIYWSPKQWYKRKKKYIAQE